MFPCGGAVINIDVLKSKSKLIFSKIYRVIFSIIKGNIGFLIQKSMFFFYLFNIYVSFGFC